MMKTRFSIIALLLIFCSFTQDSFKTEQLRYSRVREAYNTAENAMLSLLKDQNIERNKLELYLRAFKAEKKLELWGKNKTDSTFQLLKTYKICSSSGGPGPKRRQGDLQVPEGFYHINIFNPYSNFYLSLGINYPNKSDRILSDKHSPGGDIYIHGSCVTIGCIPITDPQIKELYIFCVEAKNNGQTNIPVTIFPAQMDSPIFKSLSEKHITDADISKLWADLKKGYDIFNLTKQAPEIEFLNNGRHRLKSSGVSTPALDPVANYLKPNMKILHS
ncbi:MAG: L,D-transpeptidase family protein [Bacteroidales bacterium]|nr:L,D-transpeptidase family protein [Bacteroidales bacterium]